MRQGTVPDSDGEDFSVLLINPNTSQWVTDKLATHLRGLLGSAVRIHAVTARSGAAYIASEESFAAGSQAVLDAWRLHEQGSDGASPDAVLIGCFGDPGLPELRARLTIPVLGLAQVAIGAARDRGRFAIVTGGRDWKPMLQRIVQSWGWHDQLDNITVIDASGADLAADPQRAQALLAQACREAAAPGVQRVVLGGAGFAGYGDVIANRVPVPVIDSVSAAAVALLALKEDRRGPAR